MDRDLPRRWVVKDEAMVEMAESLPDSAEELGHVRGLSKSVAKGADGAALLAAIARALAMPEGDWPEPTSRSIEVGSDALVAAKCGLRRHPPQVRSRREVRLLRGDCGSSMKA